jgi:hypothetical protein
LRSWFLLVTSAGSFFSSIVSRVVVINLGIDNSTPDLLVIGVIGASVAEVMGLL